MLENFPITEHLADNFFELFLFAIDYNIIKVRF